MNGPYRFACRGVCLVGKRLLLVGSLLALARAAAAVEPVATKTPAPPEAEKPVREISAEGYRVRLDLSTQVLGLSIPEDTAMGWDEEPAVGDEVAVSGSGVMLRAGRQVIAKLSFDQPLTVNAVKGKWIGVTAEINGVTKRGWVGRDEVQLRAREAPLLPTLAELGSGGFVSASVLAQKAKQFDDGLYAAVDLAAQQGAGSFHGKSDLLISLARSLARQDAEQLGSVAGVVLGAGKLGKLDVEIPADFQPVVQDTLDKFLENELRSKPISFYTWTDELSAIFQQDRLLQSKLEGKPGIEALVRILHADEKARAAYEQYLTLVARLTNPLVEPDSVTPRAALDLRPLLAAVDAGNLEVPEAKIRFFPPSRSHETRLVMQLFGASPTIPQGFNLVEEMIRRIRSGDLDLKPTPDSGWYDHQTWALEPLVIPEKMPEAEHLQFDDEYTKQLLELFKGILALTRETHIKQVEIPMPAEAAPGTEQPKVTIYIDPELSAEPLATHYLRRAMSYRFIRTVLEESFGVQALAKMHRLTAEGPVDQNLAVELQAVESLFYGAYVTVSRQLGMFPAKPDRVGSKGGARADAEQFSQWAADLEADPDVGHDARMMVPVFYDLSRRKTKVWAFLGWSTRPVCVDFARAPAAVVLDKDGNKAPAGRVELEFLSNWHTLAYPVTAEVYVTEILNRDEFRRHCDEHKTRRAILANLK